MTRTSHRWYMLLAILLLIGAASMASCRDRQAPLLVISGPTGLESFQLATETGEVLWSIATNDPTTLKRIDYGVVPEGFHQVVPQDGQPPRLLIPGEWLESVTESVDATFYHEGMATGPVTFQAIDSRLEFGILEVSSPE